MQQNKDSFTSFSLSNNGITVSLPQLALPHSTDVTAVTAAWYSSINNAWSFRDVSRGLDSFKECLQRAWQSFRRARSLQSPRICRRAEVKRCFVLGAELSPFTWKKNDKEIMKLFFISVRAGVKSASNEYEFSSHLSIQCRETICFAE